MTSLRGFAVVLLASASFLAPALADDAEPTTPGFKLLRDETLLTENVEPMPPLAIKLGDVEVQPEITTLMDLQKIYGGTLATFNGENRGISWVCYAVPAANGSPAQLVWFAADGVMSTNYAINFVVAELAPEGETPTCAAPTAPLVLTTGLPGLGAASADVAKLFGGDAVQDGVMSFGGAMPAPPELKFPDAQSGVTTNFLIAAGKITALTLSHVTSL